MLVQVSVAPPVRSEHSQQTCHCLGAVGERFVTIVKGTLPDVVKAYTPDAGQPGGLAASTGRRR